MRRQAGFQLALQFADLALCGAQLVLRGSLLLCQCRCFGAGLLLLVRDNRLLLMRNVEVGLQAVGSVLRQRDHPLREHLLRFKLDRKSVV